MGGAQNRGAIQEFHGAGQVDQSRNESFVYDAYEPSTASAR
jgi:hypothetical protein